jgi:hypothetical protein
MRISIILISIVTLFFVGDSEAKCNRSQEFFSSEQMRRIESEIISANRLDTVSNDIKILHLVAIQRADLIAADQFDSMLVAQVINQSKKSQFWLKRHVISFVLVNGKYMGHTTFLNKYFLDDHSFFSSGYAPILQVLFDLMNVRRIQYAYNIQTDQMFNPFVHFVIDADELMVFMKYKTFQYLPISDMNLNYSDRLKGLMINY